MSQGRRATGSGKSDHPPKPMTPQKPDLPHQLRMAIQFQTKEFQEPNEETRKSNDALRLQLDREMWNKYVGYLADFRNDYGQKMERKQLNAILLSAFIREQPNWEKDLKDNLKPSFAKWVEDFKKAVPTAFTYDDDSSDSDDSWVYVPPSDDSDDDNFWNAKCDKAEESIEDTEKSTIKYVVDELKYYLTLKDGPIEIGPVQGTWQSDSLIPSPLLDELTQNISILEGSISNKEWTDENKTVWNLLDPSDYCLIAERSRILAVPDRPGPPHDASGRSGLLNFHPPKDFLHFDDGRELAFHHRKFRRNPRINDVYIPSEEYQWLPSEFQIGEDNSVRIASYINNLHPEVYAGLYSVIEEIFQQFVPMFDKVLADFEDRIPLRNIKDGFSNPSANVFEYNLAGRTIQVITKLTNYELTPEEPEYSGGLFHSEGMSNERIIASGIYYYHSENITESRVELQHATYDRRNQMQKLGSFVTKEGRCIVFPITLEHRVAPFKLEDPNRNGYRKTLEFFLVDPDIHVISTAQVPPQQRSWFAKEIMKGPACLPEEIVDLIVSKCDWYKWYMGPLEAIKHRNGIERERKLLCKDDFDFKGEPRTEQRRCKLLNLSKGIPTKRKKKKIN